MTPKEALKLLDEVSSKFPGTRQDHILIQDAIACLRDATQPKEEPNA